MCYTVVFPFAAPLQFAQRYALSIWLSAAGLSVLPFALGLWLLTLGFWLLTFDFRLLAFACGLQLAACSVQLYLPFGFWL